MGVGGVSLNTLEHHELRVLWSEVKWPFEPSEIQKSAVEFHHAVHHIFAQTVVVPFRLLSVFDHRQSLVDFVARHGAGFIADLKRLQDTVQMECVVFFKATGPPDLSSGSAYLRQKAGLQSALEEFGGNLRNALSPVGSEIRTRQAKHGNRIYCQVQRGQEELFRTIVQQVQVPSPLERRVSGPWPPAEFLSESVKMPEVAGQR